MNQIIGHVLFVDGAYRPIFQPDGRQYVLDDEGERLDGVWMIPEEECLSPDVVVDANPHPF
jgi:hypothetical protein